MLDKCAPQGSDLQLRVPDNRSCSPGMESGKKLIEITGPALSKRKLLVALDLLCLFLGNCPDAQQKHTHIHL